MADRIFSGDGSRSLWDAINSALTVDDLRDALYTLGCKCQELEAAVRRLVSDTVQYQCPECAKHNGVYLRLHPDGHWIPDTPGEWDYTPSDRKSPTRVTVYEYKGGLNVRFPGGREESVRTVAPGTWEWIVPANNTP